MSEAVRVLIVGCGYVGSALAAPLVGRGVEVWGLRRRPHLLPPGVRPLEGDVGQASSLEPLPTGPTHLVYMVSPDAREPEAYRRAYVEGLRAILEHLERGGAPVRRTVLVTSTAVYGENDGSWVDEDTPPDPEDFRGETLLKSEEVLWEAGVPGVSLRLGGIYGPGRARVVERVRAGEARCPPGPRYGNRIHRDDCAAAVEHLLFGEPRYRVYLGVDHEPVDLCDLYRWIAAEIGAPLPSRPLSGPPAPATGKRCSNLRLREEGFRFRYPTYREGYRALLDPPEINRAPVPPTG